MARKKIAFIPLDDRPCTYLFPQSLAALVDIKLEVPPRHLLGNWKKGANPFHIRQWLMEQLSQVSDVIISLDTWIYGGLVASRKSRKSLNELQERLLWLEEMKQLSPAIGWYAFATLLRISNSNDDTEERPYWRQYGMKIHRYSYLDHALYEHEDPQNRAEWSRLKTEIPDDILTDYHQLRQRNFQLLQAMLKQVETKTLEALVIGYDDAGIYGWNVQEQQQLRQSMRVQNLSQVLLLPGADELACTLLARVIKPEKTQIMVIYDRPVQAEIETLYEGIPLNQTVATQAEAAGCQLVNECDRVLLLHTPLNEQHDPFLERDIPTVEPPNALQQLANRTQDLLRQNKQVMLADIMHANGGDKHLLDILARQGLLLQLAGYSAWNTTGNTLGLAFAWLKLLNPHSNLDRQRHFLLERLADDGIYQGYLRQLVCEHYTQVVSINDSLGILNGLNIQFQQWLQMDEDTPMAAVHVRSLTFPWQRFFEIELSIDIKMKNDAPEPHLGQNGKPVNPRF